MSSLELGRVALWHGELAASEDACRRYWPLLDAAEQNRAQRFATPLPRHRYVEAHGLLRCLVSRYVKQAPEQINIQTAEHGKPYLADFPDWTFNLSHSDNHFAVAIAQACRLGIDLEIIKPRNSLEQLADKCFSVQEAAYWRSLDDNDKTAAFYRLWTTKEAFVKATGRGIALGLEQCATDPSRPGQFARLPPAYQPAKQWRIFELEFPRQADLLGALVVDSPVSAIDRHELPDF